MEVRLNLALFLLTLCGLLRVGWGSDSRPNILLIFADDLGWSDVQFRDASMRTPNIDRLACEGVNMQSSYLQQVCTPSRAAFLTGKYPFTMGIQHSVFSAMRNNSMPTDLRTLPEHLQALGYATHMVGKWHLGFCSPEMTPTHRGFHTFYGMYNGKGDYYDHRSKWNGYDMHDDTGKEPADYRVAWEAETKYTTHLFTDKAIEVATKHDPSKPLFMYLSYQAVHGPLQVPKSYVKQYCSHVDWDEKRKLHCAMAAAMDEGIGNVTSAFDQLGLGDNLITLFISDNGGPVKEGSSNWPLRGSKITLWEGGTRVVSVLHSKKYFPDAPYEWNGIMHAIDWYPTLMKAAGYDTPITGINGVDNWEAIVSNGPSRRSEFVYNIDDVKNFAAIRDGRYKLVIKAGNPDGWFNPPPGVEPKPSPPKDNRKHMLFDLEADPNEENDLGAHADMQDIVSAMKAKLNEYRQQVVPTVEAPKVRAGLPKFHDGAWVTGFC